MMSETTEEKIARVLKDVISISPPDPLWPSVFEDEKKHLATCLPPALVRRIEHFGSTAVPGLCAKPVVDILVEVTDLEKTRLRIAPMLELQGYDFFWRPSHDDDNPPFYAWFIKRAQDGKRTHHIHMVEKSFEHHWDRLLFRDYLIDHPDVAREYGELKKELCTKHHADRVAYTKAKSEFIARITALAKKQYKEAQPHPALLPSESAHHVRQ